MNQYQKIQTIYKRDPKTNFKTLLEGEYSLPEFEYLQYANWTFTEKIDGTNIRIIPMKDRIIFKGKTDKADIPDFLLKKLEEMFPLEKFKNIFSYDLTKNDGICLYGEGYGAKIQAGGGGYRINGRGVSFILFDIKIGYIWLRREDLEDIANKLGIAVVPLLGTGIQQEAVELTRKGFDSRLGLGRRKAEGIVMSPNLGLRDRLGNRIIAKIKHKDFQ